MTEPGLTQAAAGWSFEEHATAVLGRLRAAFADVLDAAPGGRPARASQLARAFGLDTKLAWKVTKLVELPDPFEAARYAPGTAGVELFLAAAERGGVPTARVKAARDACGELNELIVLHAGDRKTFEMLLAGYAVREQEKVSLEHRRAAFDANTYLFGLQARSQLKTYLLHPSKDGRHIDLVVIAGFLNLRCIRPNTSWPVSRLYRLDEAGRVHALPSEPLEESSTPADELDLPLLRGYSSSPPPAIAPVQGPQGVIGHQRVLGGVGRTGATDFLTGEVVRAAMPARRTAASRDCAVHTRLRTPCEGVHLDLFAHRGLFGGRAPEARLYRGMFQGEVLGPLVEEDRLPLSDPIEPLGSALDDVRLPGLPRYPELLRFACSRTGWDAGAFEGWRVSMRYPPNPAILTLQQELLEPSP